ncbi:MAG: hypothetical protein ACE5JE_02035 [Thermoplasmata archaeon]
MNTMRNTNPRSVDLAQRTDRNSEALVAYVRAEYGEADVDWYLAEVRRAAKKVKRERSPNGNRHHVEAGIVSA